MIEDVHEPLDQYATYFKSAHIENTADFFEDLVRKSGVDENANREIVQQIRRLEKQVGSVSAINKWWHILRGIVVAVASCILLYVFGNYSWWWLIVPTAVFGLIFYWLNKLINGSHERIKELERACKEKYAQAWEQMEPLNRLFDWDIVAKLIQKTVPRIEFDPYFTNGRLNELQNTFGWSGELGNDHSIVFSHTGVLNGNPFVLARTLSHWMGKKTYHGSLKISWTKQVQGPDGKWRTMTRHQTLSASVERPFPEYQNQTFIVYGNEAAPDLIFSRNPSNLSKLKNGFFDRLRKKRAINKLENKSRNMEEGKTFTVMSNREFDALFDATDRNHEVQFRLLFTPLAQQETLKLLQDSQFGYGDDFIFNKSHMINIVKPAHMDATDISNEPEKFHTYELAQSRIFFNSYHNDFFRSFYFGFAPLLAIPLYQQHRSHSDIYKNIYADKSCYWEHESLANYHGEAAFKHPDCVTRSILKTVSRFEADGSQKVRVTASGYRSVERIDYVAVRGGDGHSHQVPVYWTEYFALKSASDMFVHEKVSNRIAECSQKTVNEEEKIRRLIEKHGADYRNAVLRRSIVSAVLRR